MKGAVKRAYGALGAFLTVVVIVLATALVGVRLVGLTPYVVLSGSMEPNYHVGSLVYVRDVAPESIQAGDAITFVRDASGTPITHRVVVTDHENRRFFTQGDANRTPDAAPVIYENVVGKATFSIPYLGYVSHYLSRPPGLYIGLAAAAVLFLLTFVVPELGGTKRRGGTQAARAKGGRGGAGAAVGPATAYGRGASGARKGRPAGVTPGACPGFQTSAERLRASVPEVFPVGEKKG